MNINTNTLKAFRGDFAKAVAELEKKHGIKLNLGNIRYDAESFRTTMTAVNTKETKSAGITASPEALDFKQYAESFGLKATDLGRVFINRGDKYKIIGLKPRSHKYPIIAERVIGGQRYKFSVAAIKFPA